MSHLKVTLSSPKDLINLSLMLFYHSRLEINALLRQEKRLKQMMQGQNISEALIKQIMDEGTSAWTNQDSVEHLYEEASWFFPKFSRSDAERCLRGEKETFFPLKHFRNVILVFQTRPLELF